MIGIVALALTTFVAAFAIVTYEAWWTIGLVVIGVLILAIDRSGLRRRDAVRNAVGLVGALLIGAAGLWMVVLGMFGKARPCDACFDNGLLLVPGVVVFVIAVVVGMVCGRSVARTFAALNDEGASHDNARR